MDRRRRDAPLMPRAGSHRGARLRPASLWLGVTLLIALSGCRDRKEEARQRAALTSALAQFGAQVAGLQKQSSELRARFDKLPQDLPGLDPVRDDLHTLEEVIGVEDGRTKWLALELDRTFAAGNAAQIASLDRSIPRSTAGLEQVVVKVMHELLPLERLADQRRFFEEVDAVNARRRADDR